MDKRIQTTAKNVLCWVAAAAFISLAGDAAAESGKQSSEEPTLKLGAEHLDKSREALGAEHVVVESSETKGHDGEKHRCKGHHKHHGKKHGKKHGVCDESCKARHHGRKPVARTYERCVEVSVQAKNGLDESSRVCRVLFPAKES